MTDRRARVWIIQTYLGINDLRFGMTPAEVEAVLGKPERSRNTGPDSTSEFRSVSQPIVEYSGGNATEFIFAPEAGQVMLRGINLLCSDEMDILHHLQASASDLTKSGGGTIVSIQLGVSLSGFEDPDDSNKSVGAFARGTWDRLLQSGKPVRF